MEEEEEEEELKLDFDKKLADGQKFRPDSCVLGGRETAGYDDFVRKIYQMNERHPTDPSFLLDAHFPANGLPGQGRLRASLQLRLENPINQPAPNETDYDKVVGGSSVFESKYLLPNAKLSTRSVPPLVNRWSEIRDDESAKKHENLRLYEPRLTTTLLPERRSLDKAPRKSSGAGEYFASVPAGRHLFPTPPDRFGSGFGFGAGCVGGGRRGDTRIVGSDFVLAASRPDDLFFSRIDRLLAEARSVNSWDV